MFLYIITIDLFYQQAGDAKKPYLAQYSAVVEDSPVITSWISMKINILIKNIPKPLNIHFNTFLIELFLANVANINNRDCILFYLIIIVHFSKCQQILLRLLSTQVFSNGCECYSLTPIENIR